MRISWEKDDKDWILKRFKGTEAHNPFVERNEIPLGWNTYKGNTYADKKIITIKEEGKSNVGLFVGLPGCGKTTTIKRVYFYKYYHFGRALIIIDTLGQDHYLSNKANFDLSPSCLLWKDRKGRPIEKPIGLTKLKSLTPEFIKYYEPQIMPHRNDELFGIIPSMMTTADWASLGFKRAGQDHLDLLITDAKKNRNPIKNIEDLQKRIINLPTKKDEATEDTGFVHPQTYNTLVSNINYYKKMNFFTKNRNLVLSLKRLVELINSGPVVFNFRVKDRFSIAYCGKVLQMIGYARREGYRRANTIRTIKPPCIVIEEADLHCPNYDRNQEMASTQMIVAAIRRWRKFGFDLMLATQKLSSLYPDIYDMWRYIVVGGPLGDEDYRRINSMVANEEIVKEIKNLESPRESLIIYPDRYHFDTFRPLNSIVRTQKESKK